MQTNVNHWTISRWDNINRIIVSIETNYAHYPHSDPAPKSERWRFIKCIYDISYCDRRIGWNNRIYEKKSLSPIRSASTCLYRSLFMRCNSYYDNNLSMNCDRARTNLLFVVIVSLFRAEISFSLLQLTLTTFNPRLFFLKKELVSTFL